MAKLSRPQREAIAEKRLANILQRHGIANSRTLEQKISDAGPPGQRIDPHILTPVRNRLVQSGIIVKADHANVPWFHLSDAPAPTVAGRLAEQLPIYQQLNSGDVSTRVGQQLEIATYRALLSTDLEFYGRFKDLDAHDDSRLYSREEPPQHIGARQLTGNKRLDFLVRHPSAGMLGAECKNVREWLYPDREEVIETLAKCVTLDCVPVLIARRIPYVTYLILSTCGVILHQTYNQLLPATDQALADKARHKTLLGYHDIRTGNVPDQRLLAFIQQTLPNVGDQARSRYSDYKDLLAAFSIDHMPYEEFAARVRRRSQGLHEDGDWPEGAPWE